MLKYLQNMINSSLFMTRQEAEISMKLFSS